LNYAKKIDFEFPEPFFRFQTRTHARIYFSDTFNGMNGKITWKVLPAC